MNILKITLATLLIVSNLFSAVTINWWHAMEDKLGEKVNEIANNFNKSQSEINPIAFHLLSLLLPFLHEFGYPADV